MKQYLKSTSLWSARLYLQIIELLLLLMQYPILLEIAQKWKPDYVKDVEAWPIYILFAFSKLVFVIPFWGLVSRILGRKKSESMSLRSVLIANVLLGSCAYYCTLMLVLAIFEAFFISGLCLIVSNILGPIVLFSLPLPFFTKMFWSEEEMLINEVDQGMT